MIKAIQTHYKGYHFRSRLEARWAVFFDALGIEWEYEPEGFELPDGTRYLPDFWLPQVSMWAEVKGDDFTDQEVRKCVLLADGTGHPCIMLNGSPDGRNFWVAYPKGGGYSGPDERFCDVVLSEGSYYHLEERRFYQCTGEEYPHQSIQVYLVEDCPGIKAARSARFEFGQSGATA